ncbi:hypothetical protein MIR68_007868 [Amoeboaphelidium protococcarum]|nr:hypothetical protein MIR68_007868 [Amoeboaphelidium protococcarum]
MKSDHEIQVVTAICEYNPSAAGRLCFGEGDQIRVLQQTDSGWWDGICHGQRGWFPSNHVQLPPQNIKADLNEYYGWEVQVPPVGSPKIGNNTQLIVNKLTGERVRLPTNVEVAQSPRQSILSVNIAKMKISDGRDSMPLSPLHPVINNAQQQELAIPDGGLSQRYSSVSVVGHQRHEDAENTLQNGGINSNNNDDDDVDSVLQPHDWESMRQMILKSIVLLKRAERKDFILVVGQIIKSVHAMLSASNTLEKSSHLLQSNQMLKSHYKHLIKSLCALTEYAKSIESNSMPPPSGQDGQRRHLLHLSNEVWLSVRHFTSTAEQANVSIQMQQKVQQESHNLGVGGKSPSMRSATSSSHVSVVNVYDTLSESLDELITDVSDAISGVWKQLSSETQQKVPDLIECTKEVVTQIGYLLSLLDEFNQAHFDARHSAMYAYFLQLKENMYLRISELVNATTEAVDPFAPADRVQSLNFSVQNVQSSLRDLILSVRPLLQVQKEQAALSASCKRKDSSSDHSSFVEIQSPLDDEIKPRRAFSMNLLKQSLDQRQSKDKENVRKNELVSDSAVESNGVNQQPAKRQSKLTKEDQDAQQRRRITVVGSETKLGKFFGEDVALVEQKLRKGNELDFLKVSYSSKAVLLGANGELKGATLKGVVEVMTAHDKFDVKLMHSILLTFRSFATNVELFNLLTKRFVLEPPGELSSMQLEIWHDKVLTPIRLRVVSVIKTWLDSYYLKEQDEKLLPLMRRFIDGLVKEVLPSGSTMLLRLIDRVAKLPDDELVQSKRLTFIIGSHNAPTAPSSPMMPRSFGSILELDPLELARQFTVHDFALFARIDITEFLDKSWSIKNDNSKSPNVKHLIKMSNQTTAWVASVILSEEDPKIRSQLLKYFIQVADKCLELNNYNTLMAILAAVGSSSIHRLKRTFDLLSNKTIQTLDKLRDLMSPHQNFTKYRRRLEETKLPVLPFLGRFLTDLTFIEDGNPSTLNSHPDMINLDKRLKVANRIFDIYQYQQSKFNIQRIDAVQDLIDLCVNSAHASSEMLYDLSVKLEPREQDTEKMVRLLNESGFL